MSNTVSLTSVAPSDEDRLALLAQQYGQVWLARYIAPLRGMVLIYATHEEALAAQAGLHGHLLDADRTVVAALGRRIVKKDDVASWNMAAPKRIIQLVSPPPSPPEWWNGWKEEEDGPRPAPELVVDPAEEEAAAASERHPSRVRELDILATNLYRAVQQEFRPAGAAEEEKARASGVPRVTIEAPPESLTGVPEGFCLVPPRADGK